ncbi:SusD/RagB family nutrient-binding outer membrane lipoprotein [Flavicella sediminum]|uniref:SusD/RagB family nutrient-binding outer membrane lipoprotein n=1 Tax=Flavicella sediminum TaxID=2585141 RepID=UPI00111F02F6|nr:SusD/RagB family nutrient-binding outer membrane lipoprotein [Flavicella sediminum]
MKNIIYILTILLGTSVVSCDDYLDINTSPNDSSNIEPEYLFNGAGAALSANRNGGDGSIPFGFATQIWATGWSEGWGAGAEDTYDMSIYTLNNNWSGVYVNTAKNLVQAIKIAETKTPAQPNVIAQCMTLNMLNFYFGTTMFGDMPFSEANKTEISQPKFDSQEDVLNGIITQLDEAIAMFDNSSGIVINDYYYNGDVDKWISLAKSIKFRALMLMVDKDPSKSTEIQQMLTAGGMISSSAGTFGFPYIDKTGNNHPMAAIRNAYYGPSGIEDMFPGKSLVDIMNTYNDPRRSVFFRFGYTNSDEDEYETNYIGVVATENAVTKEAGASSFFNGDVIWAGDKTDDLFTYAEQLLLEAEAQARFNNNLIAARSLLNDALAASCEKWGIADASALQAEFPIAFATKAEALQIIYEQFWVAQFDRPLEAWTTWRRSGTIGNEIPALSKPANAITGGAGGEDMFRRLVIPPDVTAANGDNAPDVEHYDRMWFDL